MKNFNRSETLKNPLCIQICMETWVSQGIHEISWCHRNTTMFMNYDDIHGLG